MADPLSRRHASGAVTPEQAPSPEPTYAERARTLVHLGRVGALSTMSRKRPGWPFGSVMPYALDEMGRPLFLISSMAMHTQNLQQDARASLLVNQSEGSADPLGAARVTLMGEVSKLPAEDLGAVRQRYLARHETARYWVDFEDFDFYRMEVADVYFVGGFGVMGWVTAEDYMHAEADPLAESAPGIIEHMNKDHSDALLLLAKAFAGVEADQASMTSVDRLGFHLRLKTADRVRSVRIAFLVQARSVGDTRKVMEQMVRLARESA
jgi:heme oxygenase (biliverdin-IX-beta and delta-forming)